MFQFGWSITIAKIRGIPIRLHLTLILFLAMIVFQQSSSVSAAVNELLYVIAVFACIALHELGHAFAAAYYKIKTRDIVLYPFGGIASITGSPEPKAELIIALAGPFVNVLIAALLLPFVSIEEILSSTLGGRILLTNIILVVFNMVPALPMDGGRVFRAFLALGGVKNATRIAVSVSKGLSFLVGALAIYWGRFDLLLIALVVFYGAAQEQLYSHAKQAIRGFQVRDAMIDSDKLVIFSHGTTLSNALGNALKSLQNFFPVLSGSSVLGVVSKDSLLQHAAEGNADTYLAELADRSYPVVGPDDQISSILERPDAAESAYFLVMHEGLLLGMLIKEKVLEFLLVDQLKRRLAEARTFEEPPSV